LRSTAGRGLGLAISKAIIQAHGGAIQVQSVPEEGSEFQIILPRSTSNNLFELALAFVIWDSSLTVNDMTLILQAVQQGDPKAAEELLPLVYDELRRLAAWRLANEVPGQTLQATALVHEAYLRLVGQQDARWQGRRHFFGAAAEAMRRILVENARRKKRLKHGGQWERVDLQDIEIAAPMPDEDLLAMNDALDRLAVIDSRGAELVKLCFFVGLTQEEAAQELGVSISTVERIWAFARAWLFREIQQGQTPPN
jgi:RNA polymerase sigma factor (TIGR02999 family)